MDDKEKREVTFFEEKGQRTPGRGRKGQGREKNSTG